MLRAVLKNICLFNLMIVIATTAQTVGFSAFLYNPVYQFCSMFICLSVLMILDCWDSYKRHNIIVNISSDETKDKEECLSEKQD